MSSNKRRRIPRLDVTGYSGRWVALDPETDQIIADGTSLREARRKAIRRGTKRPLLMVVPRSDGYFVGATETEC